MTTASAQKSQATWQEAALREALPTLTQVLLASLLIILQTIHSSLTLEPCGQRLPQCPALWPERLPCPPVITHHVVPFWMFPLPKDPSLTTPAQRRALLLRASPALTVHAQSPHGPQDGAYFVIILANLPWASSVSPGKPGWPRGWEHRLWSQTTQVGILAPVPYMLNELRHMAQTSVPRVCKMVIKLLPALLIGCKDNALTRVKPPKQLHQPQSWLSALRFILTTSLGGRYYFSQSQVREQIHERSQLREGPCVSLCGLRLPERGRGEEVLTWSLWFTAQGCSSEGPQAPGWVDSPGSRWLWATLLPASHGKGVHGRAGRLAYSCPEHTTESGDGPCLPQASWRR
ncbi:hypothetical protein VULLAG_LOCUS21991 [Vulpes lagopus]